MILSELSGVVYQICKQHPRFKIDFYDLLDLAKEEIIYGGSAENEIELCIIIIKQKLNEEGIEYESFL